MTIEQPHNQQPPAKPPSPYSFQQPTPPQSGPVGAYGDSLILDQYRRTAHKSLSTPVSFTGSIKWIWPISQGSEGWLSTLRYLGVALLIGLFWVTVTVPWYSLLLLLWLPWFIYTQRRRHRIHEARTALAQRV